MLYFCTYCDQGYLARLLCLHASLIAQHESFQFFVLCFDSATEKAVRDENVASLVAVPLAEVLASDPEYAAVRARRQLFEFYFTSTPVMLRYCFEREPRAGVLTYLDADLFFFGPPSEVMAEQGDASVGIVDHRFPPRLTDLLKFGRYNVAWVSFRRDQHGMACLEWWRERCLEWCHDYVDHGRFADQGYLDQFPTRFTNVRTLDHPGINAAPWNMDDLRVVKKNGQLWLNERPLLFYHFQGIREIFPDRFDLGFHTYFTHPSSELLKLVYRPYLETLAVKQRHLSNWYGVHARMGYGRATTGRSLRDRWERSKARWLLPTYRRLRGQLMHCPPPV